MAKTQVPKSFAEQIADLEDPTPRDIDPEEDQVVSEDEEDKSLRRAQDQLKEARDHYVDVGKSKFRKRDEVSLGPRYAGAQISRDALIAEESVDDPFTRSDAQVTNEDEDVDEEEAEDASSQNARRRMDLSLDLPVVISGTDNINSENFDSEKGQNMNGDAARVTGIDGDSEDEDSLSDSDSTPSLMEDIRDDESQEIEDSESDTSGEEPSQTGKPDERAELRRMMAEEQKTVAATISEATKADADKGRAVKNQRSIFDALLNTRIKLQKSLVATNSLSAPEYKGNIFEDGDKVVHTAELAALNLWTTLHSLRQSLHSTPATGIKRSFSATKDTPLIDLWSHMESYESTSLPTRRTILSKWSSKVNLATSVPSHSKFSNTPTKQPLTTVLDSQLSAPNIDRLIKRTRMPRSCAPLQAQSDVTEDASIYDDADFYTLLLRELVDQRMADVSTAAVETSNGGATHDPTSLSTLKAALPSATNAQREARVKKKVDTKASKGRKLRYTVHEKLQNFMAPDDRGTWGERQTDELFGSLLGRRIRLEERDGEEEGDEDGDRGEEGLRLFRS